MKSQPCVLAAQPVFVCLLSASGSDRCIRVLLQDFLGFAPSKQAVAIVQTSVQAHAVQLQRAAASRLQHAAALTAQRCAAAPLYGWGLRQVNTRHPSESHPHSLTKRRKALSMIRHQASLCSF